MIRRALIPLVSILTMLLAGLAPAEADPPQDASALPPVASVVKPHAYVSLEPVPRDREFEVAVVVEILRGFHINAHNPTEEFLIPTTLTPQLPQGFREIGTDYPDGQLRKFTFSPDKPLAVYTGSVALRMKLKAGAEAPLGIVTLPLVLRYQACNDTTCLPPVSIRVAVKPKIASAGTKAHHLHPAIFSIHAPARN